jgi:type VI secretion system secreted protein Hcp
MATKDYFLKIEGIEGESQDPKHKGEIDIESFQWGESNPRIHGISGDSGQSKVQMRDIHFTMFASKASTQLMQACANGKKFQKVTLTLRKAGSEQQEYMKFVFTDVYITSYTIGGPATETSKGEKVGHEKRENPIPIEEIALSFAQIEVEYRGQKSSGDLSGRNIFTFNLPNMRSQ